jgi:hypothetical protein
MNFLTVSGIDPALEIPLDPKSIQFDWRYAVERGAGEQALRLPHLGALFSVGFFLPTMMPAISPMIAPAGPNTKAAVMLASTLPSK